MPQHAIVIGAGIIGASVALELARKGMRVTVIERLSQPGQGSTARSSSVIRCHYTKRDAVALAHEGQRLWSQWAEFTGLESPRATYHQTGVLFLVKRGDAGPPSGSLGMKAEMDQSGIQERVETMQQVGVQTELLEAPALRAKFPFFEFPEEDVIGIWEPESGYVFSPEGAVQDLHEAGVKEGVTYRFNTSFKGTRTEWVNNKRAITGCRVEDDHGSDTLDCSILVNCAGPASHEVNRLANCPLPLVTVPQRQFIVEASWKTDNALPVPGMADLVEGFYIRPHVDVFKVGAALTSDHTEFAAALEEEDDARVRHAFETRVIEGLRRRAPGLELEHIETKVATYDWTVTDAYPILDSTDVTGFYVAIGTSGAWFKAAPVIGQLMAEWIQRCQSEDGHREEKRILKLSRSGNTINLGTFGLESRS
jgi:sarcosine oxidase subunit beta